MFSTIKKAIYKQLFWLATLWFVAWNLRSLWMTKSPWFVIRLLWNDALIVLEALQKHMKTFLCNQWQFFSEMRISWCQQTRMLDSKVESIFFGWNSKILRASEEWRITTTEGRPAGLFSCLLDLTSTSALFHMVTMLYVIWIFWHIYEKLLSILFYFW